MFIFIVRVHPVRRRRAGNDRIRQISPRFPKAGFRNRFRAAVPIDFRQIPMSGPY